MRIIEYTVYIGLEYHLIYSAVSTPFTYFCFFIDNKLEKIFIFCINKRYGFNLYRSILEMQILLKENVQIDKTNLNSKLFSFCYEYIS